MEPDVRTKLLEAKALFHDFTGYWACHNFETTNILQLVILISFFRAVYFEFPGCTFPWCFQGGLGQKTLAAPFWIESFLHRPVNTSDQAISISRWWDPRKCLDQQYIKDATKFWDTTQRKKRNSFETDQPSCNSRLECKKLFIHMATFNF